MKLEINPKNMKDLNEIKFDQLEDILSDLVGKPIKLEVAIAYSKYYDQNYFEVQSQELKNDTGVLSCVYESMRITNFGGKMSESGDSYWLPLHFSYKYKFGGSNGSELCTAWFNIAMDRWEARFPGHLKEVIISKRAIDEKRDSTRLIKYMSPSVNRILTNEEMNVCEDICEEMAKYYGDSGTCVMGMELRVNGAVAIKQWTQGNMAPEAAMTKVKMYLEGRGYSCAFNMGNMD